MGATCAHSPRPSPLTHGAPMVFIVVSPVCMKVLGEVDVKGKSMADARKELFKKCKGLDGVVLRKQQITETLQGRLDGDVLKLTRSTLNNAGTASGLWRWFNCRWTTPWYKWLIPNSIPIPLQAAMP